MNPRNYFFVYLALSACVLLLLLGVVGAGAPLVGSDPGEEVEEGGTTLAWGLDATSRSGDQGFEFEERVALLVHGSGRRSGQRTMGTDAMHGDGASVALPHPKDRGLMTTMMMMKCKKKDKNCRATKKPTKAPVKPPTKAPVKPPTKAPVKPPTNAPTEPPTGECTRVSECAFEVVQCRSSCECHKDTEGVHHCVDRQASTTGCSARCTLSSQCPVGQVCIPADGTCCTTSCLPLCTK
jgi:hypothetical protein